MDTLWQDLRHGFRMLGARPSISVVSVLMLASAIGVTTATFSVAYTVLLSPLPYKDPDQLISIYESNPAAGIPWAAVSPPNFLDWRARQRALEEIAAIEYHDFNLASRVEPERIRGALISPSLFRLLGVEPILGRAFLPEEEQLGDNVVVLSHSLWQRRFGSDRDPIGNTLTLNGMSFTVVGVMPRGFQFPFKRELWAPLRLDASNVLPRSARFLNVVARLESGMSLAGAQAELDTIAHRLQQEYPDTNAGWAVNLFPLHEELEDLAGEVVGNIRPALVVLLGAASFVLLIVFGTVANLLLARAETREQEIAIRMAVGASRSRLVRQLLTEYALLVAAASVSGVLLAIWGVDLLFAGLDAGDISRVNEVGTNEWMLGFTLVSALLTGAVFCLAPALKATNPDLHASLKAGGRIGGRRRRFFEAVVVTEVALAFVLLAGASLTIRSFLRLHEIDLGFDSERVLTMATFLPESAYPEPQQRAAFFRQVLDRIENLPSVRYAGAIHILPLSGYGDNVSIFVEGRSLAVPANAPQAEFRAVCSGYFRAMGIPLLTGRDFTAVDMDESSGVAIINENMARRLWPNEDPIGKRFRFEDPEAPWVAIVGVVGNVRHRLVGEPGKHFGSDLVETSEAYVPYLLSPFPKMTLVVRTGSDPSSLAAAVRSQVRSIDPKQPVYDVRTMEQVASEWIARARFSMLSLCAFGAVGLVLAGVGIYGVMAYYMTQRTYEIGIRLALGARPSEVVWLAVRHGGALTTTGLALGLAVAFATTRVMKSLLFGVSATDPELLAAVAIALAAVALAACYLPARWATKVDPVIVLRHG